MPCLKLNWRAKWDEFRTTNWQELIQHPGVVSHQMQELLAIAA
jgi:hypothetical protein